MQHRPKFKTVEELLSDPKRWTQGAFALDAQGKPCDARSDEACRWCLMGALLHVYATFTAGPVWQFRQALEKGTGSASLSAFNDNNTHEQVLALVRRVGL